MLEAIAAKALAVEPLDPAAPLASMITIGDVVTDACVGVAPNIEIAGATKATASDMVHNFFIFPPSIATPYRDEITYCVRYLKDLVRPSHHAT
jgi:hypothetical protein